MFTIHEFCKERLIPKKIEEAFQSYCKASLSEYFDIRASDTLSKIILRLNEGQVEDLWVKFVSDFARLLTAHKELSKSPRPD